jgi:hypothetical protein
MLRLDSSMAAYRFAATRTRCHLARPFRTALRHHRDCAKAGASLRWAALSHRSQPPSQHDLTSPIARVQEPQQRRPAGRLPEHCIGSAPVPCPVREPCTSATCELLAVNRRLVRPLAFTRIRKRPLRPGQPEKRKSAHGSLRTAHDENRPPSRHRLARLLVGESARALGRWSTPIGTIAMSPLRSRDAWRRNSEKRSAGLPARRDRIPRKAITRCGCRT